MRIFYSCIKNVVIVSFPLLIAINCFYFLLLLNPELNFLGIDTSIYHHLQTLGDNTCPYGATVYFGLSSLKRMLEAMPTDRTVSIIRSLGYSFKTANFMIPQTMPNMASVGKENILNILKVMYIVLGYLFHPLIVLGWLAYAVYDLIVEIWGMLEVVMKAFGGWYADGTCNHYPPVIDTINYLRSVMI